MARLVRFRRRLERVISVQRLLVFGSTAAGDRHRDSDVDLILVSEAFRNQDYRDRYPPLADLWEPGLALDLICLTPEEFEERREGITLVTVALAEGVDVAA